jgi:transposase
MAGELKHRLGVPYRKICDFLETYCGLHAAPATFVRAEQRLAERARPTYDLLIDALRRCHIVHADETGWRVAALNACLWVFSNQDITIYAIRTGPGAHGHEVPEEILGPDFDGFLIVDGGKAYECLSYAKGQCNAHLLRRTHELGETVSPREQTILQTLSTLIQEAIDLAERRPSLSHDSYAHRVQKIEMRLENWLLDHCGRLSVLSADLQRLVKHVANHHDQWLLFLHDSEVPPTNNHAERMLRPAVITRKVGGCNKTLLGALVHSILASLMVTCKQQILKFLDLARQLWRTEPPQAIPLIPLNNPATPAGSP